MPKQTMPSAAQETVLHCLSETAGLAAWQILSPHAARRTLDALVRRGWAIKENQNRNGWITDVWRRTQAGTVVLQELANV